MISFNLITEASANDDAQKCAGHLHQTTVYLHSSLKHLLENHLEAIHFGFLLLRLSASIIFAKTSPFRRLSWLSLPLFHRATPGRSTEGATEGATGAAGVTAAVGTWHQMVGPWGSTKVIGTKYYIRRIYQDLPSPVVFGHLLVTSKRLFTDTSWCRSWCIYIYIITYIIGFQPAI